METKKEEIQREKRKQESLTLLNDYNFSKQEHVEYNDYLKTRLDKEHETSLKEKLNLLEILVKDKEINNAEIERRKALHDIDHKIEEALLALRLQEVQAEVDAVVSKANAISPDLIAALQAFGDKELAQKMADSMAPLAILGGKSVADVFSQLLKGTKLEHLIGNSNIE